MVLYPSENDSGLLAEKSGLEPPHLTTTDGLANRSLTIRVTSPYHAVVLPRKVKPHPKLGLCRNIDVSNELTRLFCQHLRLLIFNIYLYIL